MYGVWQLGKGGNCRSTGVMYEVRCKKCDRKYIGEMSRNAFTRGREHGKVLLRIARTVRFMWKNTEGMYRSGL